MTEERLIKVLQHDPGCPACESNQTNEITPKEILRSSTINSIRCAWKWQHCNYQCNTCGHIFNAHTPSQTSLVEYYQGQLEHLFEDYNASKRINFISQHTSHKTTGKAIDYGSNKPLSFHNESLPSIGYEVICHDIGNQTSETIDESKYLHQIDLITSYFCLEHLTKQGLDEFFAFCQRALTSTGEIVIELPCVSEYFYNYSGLLYEHQQHFNPSSLDKLASRFDFKIKVLSYNDCSRTFGFVALLTRNKESKPDTIFRPRHSALKASFLQGKKNQKFRKEYPKMFVSQNALNNKQNVIIWGINDYYLELKESFGQSVIAIDNNPKKEDWLAPGDTYYNGSCFLKQIEQGDYPQSTIVITASSHYKEISSAIRSKSSCKEIDLIIYSPIE